LSHFWLEEIRPEDLETIKSLPPLEQTLPDLNSDDLTDLAVEHQRLFGFNLPPYESVFIDPSAMLMAPATERIQTLYRHYGWQMPPELRAGAPDHIGVELLALADWLDLDQLAPARQLHGQHLALWGPPFILTLQRLSPHTFYQTLAELTLDLLLTTLPDTAIPAEANLLPALPPPPVYHGTGERLLKSRPEISREISGSPAQTTGGEDPPAGGPGEMVKQLLAPRSAGLFFTRADLAGIGQRLDLPVVVGDRFKMMQSLFRQTVQYELAPDLLEQLDRLLTQVDAAYRDLGADYPHWTPYAEAWRDRLSVTRSTLKRSGVTPQ
jgi:TorA maturation chaperone TorD